MRGRADGYDPDQNLIEEIKTYRGDLAAMPANHRHLHWAQVRVYGHLLCQQLDLEEVNLALVYFDIGKQTETVLRETAARRLRWRDVRTAVRALRRMGRSRNWRTAARATRRWRRCSSPTPTSVPASATWPRPSSRPTPARRCVLAQAPTGIGKTVGSLFPVLKAAPQQQLDKVFYLAAKTPGRQLALDAASDHPRARPR